MKPSSSLLACAALLSALSAQAAPPAPGLAVEGKVIRVLDGDTVEVELRRVVRVRLLDCWAPEIHTTNQAEKNRGELARKHCERLALNRHGTLWIPTENARQIGDVTTLGRVLGFFWPEGSEKSVSEMMVEAGYATKAKQ